MIGKPKADTPYPGIEVTKSLNSETKSLATGEVKEAIAAIFDMDGTLIDNNKYHFEAFRKLFEAHHFPELTEKVFDQELSGRPGIAGLKSVLGNTLSDEELKALYTEKNDNYKKAYAPFIKPINGLELFLADLRCNGIKTALASSATPANVEFILSHLNIRQFFDAVIDSSRLSKGKPDPEIFLTAAVDLGMQAQDCVVFEDSIAGVQAANNAKMKVIAITTTHHAGELKPVNLVIDDYTVLNASGLTMLFN